jgi:hypothetical protein
MDRTEDLVRMRNEGAGPLGRGRATLVAGKQLPLATTQLPVPKYSA